MLLVIGQLGFYVLLGLQLLQKGGFQQHKKISIKAKSMTVSLVTERWYVNVNMEMLRRFPFGISVAGKMDSVYSAQRKDDANANVNVDCQKIEKGKRLMSRKKEVKEGCKMQIRDYPQEVITCDRQNVCWPFVRLWMKCVPRSLAGCKWGCKQMFHFQPGRGRKRFPNIFTLIIFDRLWPDFEVLAAGIWNTGARLRSTIFNNNGKVLFGFLLPDSLYKTGLASESRVHFPFPQLPHP